MLSVEATHSNWHIALIEDDNYTVYITDDAQLDALVQALLNIQRERGPQRRRAQLQKIMEQAFKDFTETPSAANSLRLSDAVSEYQAFAEF